ncbi:MAG: hypothetical protein D6776_01420 [Planctomycetota bacterium]|nr:MAG: hypothetical protein D6776_01420 [Planctomycetota bacterium]
MGSVDALEQVRQLVRRRRKHPVDAYAFIFDALDYTLRRIGERRHVTGQELCEGIRELALEQFGPLAATVFRQWGIESTRDFGRMVFDLVDVGLMGKTEQDDIRDFDDVYDFAEAFDPQRAVALCMQNA